MEPNNLYTSAHYNGPTQMAGCPGCNKPLYEATAAPAVLAAAQGPIFENGGTTGTPNRGSSPYTMQSASGPVGNGQIPRRSPSDPSSTLQGAAILGDPRVIQGVGPTGVDYLTYVPGQSSPNYVPDVYITEPPSVPLESVQYMNGFMRTQLGKEMTVEFMIGTGQLVSRTGVLVVVGFNYIVLYDFDTRTYTACDFYDIKFVTTALQTQPENR